MPPTTQDKENPPTTTADHSVNPTLTFGQYLRQERLKKKIALEEIAAATGIRLSILTALEEDNRENLPAEVFVRGFIRIYANYLTLNADECLTLYWKQNETGRQSTDGINTDKLSRIQAMTAARLFSPLQIFGIIILIPLIIFLCYQGIKTFRVSDNGPDIQQVESTTVRHSEKETITDSDTQPQQTTENTLQTDEQNPAPARDTGEKTSAVYKEEPATADTLATEANNYVLQVDFTEDTWLWIQIDDLDSKEFTFRKGEKYTWKAGKNIDIYFGNAGGVGLNLNGKQLPPLGQSGHTIKISIPKDFSS